MALRKKKFEAPISVYPRSTLSSRNVERSNWYTKKEQDLSIHELNFKKLKEVPYVYLNIYNHQQRL